MSRSPRDDEHPHQHSHPDMRSNAVHTHVADSASLDLLDLDGEVLADYWSSALSWVHAAVGRRSATTLLDLGAGTGTGSIGLARRFQDADIFAVDLSGASLHRLMGKARRIGFADRVHTIEADLDSGLPDVPRLDLTWASMSMHHLADPDRVLREVHDVTRPDGMIALAEFAEPLRFLSSDERSPEYGFEARAMSSLQVANTEKLPTLGTDWARRLQAACWNVVDEKEFVIDLDPPTHRNAGQYAYEWFSRLSAGVAGRLDSDDQVLLNSLLDADNEMSLRQRTDLHIRGVRTVILAQRGDISPRDR
jgi:SAM-dependent methyltransferase